MAAKDRLGSQELWKQQCVHAFAESPEVWVLPGKGAPSDAVCCSKGGCIITATSTMTVDVIVRVANHHAACSCICWQWGEAAIDVWVKRGVEHAYSRGLILLLVGTGLWLCLSDHREATC